jgi:ABC-2 type transport system ATP-binding protein
MNETLMISFKSVSKSFFRWQERPNNLKKILSNMLKAKTDFGAKREFQVLKDINFEIHRGEFVGIMGRNGAGKSTMLKLISSIYQPTTGQIYTKGRIAPLLELGAGFSEELSGYENVFLNAAILGYGKKHIESLMNEILDFSELGEHIFKPVRTYSSGMLVRLGFSIAVHLDVPIFLFDEVLAVGDAGFQNKCIAKIKEIYQSGRTIVLVTHSVDLIKSFCSRCILIDGGVVVFDGAPNEVAQRYEDLFTLK